MQGRDTHSLATALIVSVVVLLLGSAVLVGCGEDPTTRRSDPVAVPVVDSGSRTVDAVRLDASEPTVRWHRDVGGEVNWLTAMPGGLLYVEHSPDGSQSVVALDADGGEELWRHALEFETSSRPAPDVESDARTPFAVVDPVVVVQSDTWETAIALDPSTGRELWTRDSDAYTPLAGSAFVDGACVWAEERDARDDPVTVCLDATSGSERWRAPGWRLADGDEVAAVKEAGELHGLDHTGAVVWTVLAMDPTAVRMAGNLVLACQGGVLSAFDSRGGDLRWNVEVGADDSACYQLTVGRERVFALANSELVGVELDTGTATRVAVPSDLYLSGYGTAIFDDRQLLDGNLVVEATSGELTRMDRVSAMVGFTSAGAVRVLQASVADDQFAELDMVGPSGEVEWSVPIGWGDPELVVDDVGIVLANAGRVGEVWSVGNGDGPLLIDELAKMTDGQRVPTGHGVLTSGSVFGVVLGTPIEQAEDELTTMMGPPTGLASWLNDGTSRATELSWGSLEVQFEQDDSGALVLSGWAVARSLAGAAWPLAGDVTVHSHRSELEAVGFAFDTEAQQACRPDDPTQLCAYFGGTETMSTGSGDQPFWVGPVEPYVPSDVG